MRVYSKIFNNEYSTEDTIKIVNPRQAGLYIKNDIKLVDLFWSKNALVFVFNREESKGAVIRALKSFRDRSYFDMEDIA